MWSHLQMTAQNWPVQTSLRVDRLGAPSTTVAKEGVKGAALGAGVVGVAGLMLGVAPPPRVARPVPPPLCPGCLVRCEECGAPVDKTSIGAEPAAAGRGRQCTRRQRRQWRRQWRHAGGRHHGCCWARHLPHPPRCHHHLKCKRLKWRRPRRPLQPQLQLLPHPNFVAFRLAS